MCDLEWFFKIQSHYFYLIKIFTMWYFALLYTRYSGKQSHLCGLLSIYPLSCSHSCGKIVISDWSSGNNAVTAAELKYLCMHVAVKNDCIAICTDYCVTYISLVHNYVTWWAQNIFVQPMQWFSEWKFPNLVTLPLLS